ncbi:MAG TPA: Gfo/Idh/MocA family oxidoreductase [Desulfuromonadaceae bacterium]|nr:Gfo/Idh/MocA family oxidoreductase [Desulfuromonadaceae bacterium]
MKKLRFGFLSTANIGRKNWLAILNSGNGVVSAVASRDAARSRQFISECQAAAPFENVPTAFGSYDELLQSKDVDAVYVPLPTGLRKEFVVRAAEAGKHVLCEKPCASNLAELKEMIAGCEKNKVQFMDGVMFMHSRRLGSLRAVLDDKTSIGPIKRIASQFTFCGSEEFHTSNIRVDSRLEPLGCLGDLGWYCLRFTLWAMNWQMPERIEARMLSRAGKSNVPTEFSAELFFNGGTSASFYCSFLVSGQQWATISGTNGCLYLSDFVLPYDGKQVGFETRDERLVINGCDFRMQPNTKHFSLAEHANSHSGAQESNMFRAFADHALSGKLNKDWPMWALKTQEVVDACFREASKRG